MMGCLRYGAAIEPTDRGRVNHLRHQAANGTLLRQIPGLDSMLNTTVDVSNEDCLCARGVPLKRRFQELLVLASWLIAPVAQG